jgi:hypothetical protein
MGDGINTFNEKDLSLCVSCVKVGLNFLTRANYSLEMVHNDICGPLNPPTQLEINISSHSSMINPNPQ